MIMIVSDVTIMMMRKRITDGFLPGNLSSPQQPWNREGLERGAGEGQRGGGGGRGQVA